MTIKHFLGRGNPHLARQFELPCAFNNITTFSPEFLFSTRESLFQATSTDMSVLKSLVRLAMLSSCRLFFDCESGEHQIERVNVFGVHVMSGNLV